MRTNPEQAWLDVCVPSSVFKCELIIYVQVHTLNTLLLVTYLITSCQRFYTLRYEFQQFLSKLVNHHCELAITSIQCIIGVNCGKVGKNYKRACGKVTSE